MPPKSAKPTFYTVGQYILCKHLGVKYEAKILEVEELESGDPNYLVHYQGWNSRYDEHVRHSQSNGKIFEATLEAVAEAKQQRKESQQPKKKKTRVENVSDDKSENGSRGSSPSAFGLKSKSNKRKATDSPALGAEKPTFEINVSLPKPLRMILIDDADLINKNYLSKVPARVTIDQIIEDYRVSLGAEKDESTVNEFYVEYENGNSQLTADSIILSAKGVVDYFNYLLDAQLLYKFEQPQYQELVEKEKNTGKPVANKKSRKSAAAAKESSPSTPNAEDEFRPSKHYGIVHLLRLLMRMPSLLKLSPWNDYVLKGITQTIHDFLVFLNKNIEKYFDSNEYYSVAPTDYYRLTHQT